MDTQFAKVVVDMSGRWHILIEGTIVSLHGSFEENNRMVDIIVRGLRGPVTGCLSAVSSIADAKPFPGGSAPQAYMGVDPAA